MALSKLDSLYMAVVTEHSRHPHHRGLLPGIEPTTKHNPSCGDVISLTVTITDGTITAIGWDGEGCSISMASASMMGDCLLGKGVADALAMAELFSDMVQGKPVPKDKDLGDATFLAGVSKFPQRIKCATLAWNGVKKVLGEDH